ncbi:MAG: trigger factor [Clostridiaceae bacterium]|nr:trigger factor [Clostridiaceae bacterium]NBI83023.1 trigger factor [Clostridiaceae bacterium]
MELKKTEKLEKSVVALTMEISAAEFEKAKNQAFKKAGRNIQVPGFRKGKAPRMLIEKMYGDVFFEDALNIVYPDAMEKAVEESGIKPVGPADVELGEGAPEGGVVLIAKVPVEPEVTLGEYKGLAAEKASVSVPAKEVKEELERMAKRMARVENVERKAKKGDTVTIDFEGFIDGVPFDGGKGENHDLELGSGSFIPGFEDQLIGCKPGDEKDVEVTFPEEYHAEELKGKPAVFKCTVHAVKQTILPEMDDEFAKDVSETAETIDDLKKEITENLTKSKTDAADREFEEKLLDQVLEGMQAEIPQVMFDSEADVILNDFGYRLQMQGISLDQYVRMQGMDLPSFRKVFLPQAERQVKVRLALRKIVELESIEVSEEDLNAEYAKLAERYGMEDAQIRAAVTADAVTDDLKLNRALAVIKDSAKVKKATRKKKAEEAPADAPAEETAAE